MYELIQVTGKCYYVDSPSKVGIIKINEKEVVLIDSGNDKDAAKKILKHINENGWTLKAIYNTHSHADHIGGNKYLQSQTGCKIYAHGIECDFTNHPILEPTFLYGGRPPRELCYKFLLASESIALPLCCEVLEEGIEMVCLPGHSPDMVGFKTDDGVMFLGDCLASEKTLEKYGLGYNYDIAKYIETLESIKKLSSKVFIPSHAEVSADITELAQKNIDHVQTVGEKITAICREPMMFEDILKALFDEYGMTMNISQYVLIGSTLRSYLTWLCENGKVHSVFDNNRMLWQSV